FIGGFWSGGALNSSKKPGETTRNDSKTSPQSNRDLPGTPNSTKDGNNTKPMQTPTVTQSSDPNISSIDPKYREGMKPDRFKKTIDSIDQIIKEIKGEKGEENDDILTALYEVLNVPDLDYKGAKKYDPQEQIKWVKAIHLYQKKLGDQLGYIDDNTKKTMRSLKQDIEFKLSIRYP
ncbi:hypothetical protein IQ270_29740, partial [Microcoleus sp. LEGE 07076]|uniref:hypothetical protein n=1 Tax=Microcoleus sp. LEGE 07076 TaxID=915322 RepID=UPI00188194F6